MTDVDDVDDVDGIDDIVKYRLINYSLADRLLHHIIQSFAEIFIVIDSIFSQDVKSLYKNI